MRALQQASIRSAIAAATFAASALLTVGTAVAAPGDYCNYADGVVYCGTEEGIHEGDPALTACVARWERAVWSCPPGFTFG